MAQNNTFSKFLKPSKLNYDFIEIITSLLLAVFLIFFTYNSEEYKDKIKLNLMRFFQPIYIVVGYPVNKINYFYDNLIELNNLNRINVELKNKIKNFENKIREMNQLQVENFQLKNLLNLDVPPATKKIAARIIIDPSNNMSSNIFFDIGRNDGVDLNLPIFNENGFLGRVVRSSANISEVLLITDPKSSLPVISEETNHKFFVEGNINNLKIKHLDNDLQLKEGEIIISTSTAGYFKEGIAVGVVKKNKNNNFIIIPVANKSDSVFVMTMTYDFQLDHPEFFQNDK